MPQTADEHEHGGDRGAFGALAAWLPIQRVADVSERIEDLSDVPDAPRDEMRAIRDAARQKNEETPVTPWRDHAPECCGVAMVLLWFLRCGTRSPDSWNSSRSEARLMP